MRKPLCSKASGSPFSARWQSKQLTPFCPIRDARHSATIALFSRLWQPMHTAPSLAPAKAGKAGLGSYFDWIFLLIVFGVGTTGMLSWALRLADMNVGYTVYYFHLVFIWSLFAYAPYSKFAHLFYRTTAMVFSLRSGREKK